MCGICGIANDPDGTHTRAMAAAMRHRGPDDEHVHIDSKTGVALGCRRLAIIDVDGGRQPLANEDGSVWATLNGEIYNHPALREGLLAHGHAFASRTDTEVLVHLYEEYGDALVHALEGMFAFAVWDARRGRLLVARDRFGEKPLFYTHRGGNLAFASELSALSRERCQGPTNSMRQPSTPTSSTDTYRAENHHHRDLPAPSRPHAHMGCCLPADPGHQVLGATRLPVRRADRIGVGARWRARRASKSPYAGACCPMFPLASS